MECETLSRVVDCIAATTRYPARLLTADADLETELGIDSVKRLEIVIGLGEEFGLDLQVEERDPTVRTIGDIAAWIDRYLDQSKVTQDDTQEFVAGRADDLHRNNSDRSHVASQPRRPPIPAPHYLETATADAKLATSEKTLIGRVVFVTGSGRGIGQTVARVLASQGATVIVNSFHSREEGERTVAAITDGGGKAIHLWGSVAKPEHVNDMFLEIEDQFGHLDVLICNASDGRIGSFLDITPEDWDRAFRTNVSGHHQCAIRAARLMRVRGGGSIITMSAVGAHYFVDGLGSQGVVKAAVESLTRYLACELGPFGVRVNCIIGGPVYGELLSKFPGAGEAQSYWESIAPDRELSSPMDLAHTIEFLISERARGINGAIWTVDHGFSSHLGSRSLRRASGNMAGNMLS